MTRGFFGRKNYMIGIIFTLLVIFIVQYIYVLYTQEIKSSKNQEHIRLESIVRTLSNHIDGDLLAALFDRYPQKDDIFTSEQDSVYAYFHNLLYQAEKSNQLSSPIYTLSIGDMQDRFFFGVTSSETPYFRHVYSEFPEYFKTEYDKGFNIDPYHDEFGSWITSFVPITNNGGETVAVVVADKRFDTFIEHAQEKAFKNSIIYGSIMAVVGLVLFFFIRKSIADEAQVKRQLSKKFDLEIKNRSLEETVKESKDIVDKLFPKIELRKDSFEKMFHVHLPVEFVGNSYFWTCTDAETNNSILVGISYRGHKSNRGLKIAYVVNAITTAVEIKKLTSPKAIRKHLISSANELTGEDIEEYLDIIILTTDFGNRSVTYSGKNYFIFYQDYARVFKTIPLNQTLAEESILTLYTDEQFFVISQESLMQMSGPDVSEVYAKKSIITILKESTSFNLGGQMGQLQSLITQKIKHLTKDNTLKDNISLLAFRIEV